MHRVRSNTGLRWFLATALLVFGLVTGGVSCRGPVLEHAPARCGSRAIAAHRSLRESSRRNSREEIAQPRVSPAAALLLMAFAVSMAPRRFHLGFFRAPRMALVIPWLTPYLFRPPPSFRFAS